VRPSAARDDSFHSVLAKHRLSNNVGGVKHFLSTQQHALEEERHFALVEGVPYPTKARSQSLFRSGTQSDPCISSIALSIMIPSSNSPVRRSGTPQSIARCFTAHHGDVRAVPRADRICLPARSPIPCASSSTAEWLACGPSRPWRSSVRVEVVVTNDDWAEDDPACSECGWVAANSLAIENSAGDGEDLPPALG
jgi:hypothetical protein